MHVTQPRSIKFSPRGNSLRGNRMRDNCYRAEITPPLTRRDKCRLNTPPRERDSKYVFDLAAADAVRVASRRNENRICTPCLA